MGFERLCVHGCLDELGSHPWSPHLAARASRITANKRSNSAGIRGLMCFVANSCSTPHEARTPLLWIPCQPSLWLTAYGCLPRGLWRSAPAACAAARAPQL